mgnify:CR=1 FL=1
MTGTRTATFITNGSGLYAFLAGAAGEYTVRPIKLYYNFNPPSATFSLTNQRLNLDFIATRQTYSITGQVRDDNNQPLDGIAITLVNEADGTTRTGVTASGGSYSLRQCRPATASQLLRQPMPTSSFSPQSIDTLVSDRVVNFQAVRRTYSITGTLTGSVGNGLAAGATVNLSGSREATTTTDQNGNYAFAGLPAAGNYSVGVETTPYYTFTPQSFNDLNGNRVGNFSGSLRSYTVSGWVHLGPNAAPGLVVPISGSQTATVTTDAEGNY